jgi:hypothetical protein
MCFWRAVRGEDLAMRWQQRIRLEKHGVSIVADVNAAMAVNRSVERSSTNVDAVSDARVVQGCVSRQTKADRTQQAKSEKEDGK